MPTMTAGEIRSRVQSIMGDTSKTFITDQDVWDWISDAQQQISKITECLVSDLAAINSVANQERYTLNDAIIKVKRVTYQNRALNRITAEHLDEIDPHRDIAGNSGVPTHFYIDGANLGLWKKPATAVVSAIRIRAVILATQALAADATVLLIPDFFREDIIRYCNIKGREKDESPEFLAVLYADWKDKLSISKSIMNNQTDGYLAVRDIESTMDYTSEWYV